MLNLGYECPENTHYLFTWEESEEFTPDGTTAEAAGQATAMINVYGAEVKAEAGLGSGSDVEDASEVEAGREVRWLCHRCQLA